MKPFVIYVDMNTDKVTLSKEDFEKYLKEAYENGYEEGKKANTYTGIRLNDSIPSNRWPLDQVCYTTTNEPARWDYTTITCNDNDRNSIIKSGHVGD